MVSAIVELLKTLVDGLGLVIRWMLGSMGEHRGHPWILRYEA
jgi:hypothetical protein